MLCLCVCELCVCVCVTKELVVSLICIIDFGLYSTCFIRRTSSSRTHTHKTHRKITRQTNKYKFSYSFSRKFQLVSMSSFFKLFCHIFRVLLLCVRTSSSFVLICIILVLIFIFYASPVQHFSLLPSAKRDSVSHNNLKYKICFSFLVISSSSCNDDEKSSLPHC